MQEYIILYSGDSWFNTRAENIKDAAVQFMQTINKTHMLPTFRNALVGCNTTQAIADMLTYFSSVTVEKIVRVCDPDDNRPKNPKTEKPALRIVVMIENGALTGVYSDGDPVMVDLIDYDDLASKSDEAGYAEAEEIEAEIKSGKLVSCW